MFAKFATFLKDDSGATAIEYALIAGIVSVGLIGGATSLGNSSTLQLENIADHME